MIVALAIAAPGAAFAQAGPNAPLPPFIPAPPLATPPELPRFPDYPANHASRTMVLPELVGAATLALVFDQRETFSLPSRPLRAQVANVGLEFAIGVGTNSELDLGLTVPTEDITHARVAFRFRAIRTAGFELGLEPAFGVRADALDPKTQVLLRPALSAPIYVRAGNIFRFETGLTMTVDAPTDGDSPASVGFARYGVDPTFALPGIPAGFTFQPYKSVFLGFGTGYGVRTLRHPLGTEGARTSFMSLDAHLGGTVSLEGRPLLDVIGRFAFPYFLVGADPDPPATHVWQVGITAQTFVPL